MSVALKWSYENAAEAYRTNSEIQAASRVRGFMSPSTNDREASCVHLAGVPDFPRRSQLFDGYRPRYPMPMLDAGRSLCTRKWTQWLAVHPRA